MLEDTAYRRDPRLVVRARELRKPLTPAESKLWARLRNRQLSFKFHSQHEIGRFIADFYCAEARLVIEVDGDSHAAQVDYDVARTEWLEQHGYRVIRFTNAEVHQHLEAVLEVILVECQNSKLRWRWRVIRPLPSPNPLPRWGEGFLRGAMGLAVW